MSSHPSRQPVFRIPLSLVFVVALLVGIHAVRQYLPDDLDSALLARFAFVPGRFTFVWDQAGVLSRLAASGIDDPARLDLIHIGRFFLGDGSLQPWTVLSYALLHGNWTHVGLNCIWLLAFGTPVARRLGPRRFWLFLALGAFAGVAVHYLAFPFDLQPLIGASAAVSGCMGATLRFMFRSDAMVVLGESGPDGSPVILRPAVSLLQMLRSRGAVTFLVVWFVTNLVTGLGAVTLGLSDMPIAWQAHIGGFLFGLLAFPLFDRVRAVPPAEQRDQAAH